MNLGILAYSHVFPLVTELHSRRRPPTHTRRKLSSWIATSGEMRSSDCYHLYGVWHFEIVPHLSLKQFCMFRSNKKEAFFVEMGVKDLIKHYFCPTFFHFSKTCEQAPYKFHWKTIKQPWWTVPCISGKEMNGFTDAAAIAVYRECIYLPQGEAVFLAVKYFAEV